MNVHLASRNMDVHDWVTEPGVRVPAAAWPWQGTVEMGTVHALSVPSRPPPVLSPVLQCEDLEMSTLLAKAKHPQGTIYQIDPSPQGWPDVAKHTRMQEHKFHPKSKLAKAHKGENNLQTRETESRHNSVSQSKQA